MLTSPVEHAALNTGTLYSSTLSFSILIGLSLGVIAGLLNVPALVYLAYLWSLAVFIPSLAVSVRRLHDIGRSGWWLLLSLIPLVGAIILIIWYCTDSQPGANQYGPNPKEMDY